MTATEMTVSDVYLVRYGTVPEVARFANESSDLPSRGQHIVILTSRGLQMGQVLERLKSPLVDPETGSDIDFKILRTATPRDIQAASDHMRECETAFADWCARICHWNLNLELIDLEWTLDREKLILYVLCDRGPDSTKLALQAAAGGWGIVEVQPVSATGLVTIPQSSCGSGGCGCHNE